MIANYSSVRPQLLIAANLEETSDGGTPENAVCVVGPAYHLARYSEDECVGVAFDASGMNLDWQRLDGSTTVAVTGANVDLDSVRLYAENLRAELASFSVVGGKIKVSDLTRPNVLKISSGAFKGTSLDTAFRGRDTAIGDIVRISDGLTVRQRTVTGFIGVDVDASFGSNGDKDNEEAANSTFNPTTDATADAAVTVLNTSGGTVTVTQTSLQLNELGSSIIGGKVAEEFIITAVEGGDPGSGVGSATFTITSLSGIYSAEDVKATDSGGDFVIDDAALAGASILIEVASMPEGAVIHVRVFQAYSQLAMPDNLTIAGTYTGTKDTTYLIVVTSGSTGDTADGAVVTVSDTAGLTAPAEVTVADGDAFALGGYGLTATFALESTTVSHEGLRAGDVYYVYAKAAAESTTSFDRVILSGPAVDILTYTSPSVALLTTFNLAFSGRILATDAEAGDAWTASATDLEVASGLALYVPERDTSYKWVAYTDAVGEVFAHFRSVVPATSATAMESLASADDLFDALGPAIQDNTLAYGVLKAISGSQGLKVYYINTGGVSAAAFTAALRKTESSTAIYELVFCTEDDDVLAVCKSHVATLSSASRINPRKGYFGYTSPGSYPVLELQSDDSPFTAIITEYGDGNLLVTLQDNDDNIDLDSIEFEAGDLVKLTAVDEEYEIAEKLSATEIVLVTGPASPVGVATPIQVWRADTVSSQKAAIIAKAKSLAYNRMTMVWVEDGTITVNGSPEIVSPQFVAAEIGGLRSAIPAQSPLSRTEITAITSAPAMYNRYTEDDLNEIASYGVMIVAQDVPNGPVYIRHQLTTDSSHGELYYEDNTLPVADTIRRRLKTRFAGYPGKKSAAQTILDRIYSGTFDELTEASQADIDSEYGPLIAGFENLTVTRHPVNRAHVIVGGKIFVDGPLNVLEFDLTFALPTA